jgi:hypothetical protein
MNKIEKQVLRLLSVVTETISNEHNVDLNAVNETVKRIVTCCDTERVRCNGHKLNGDKCSSYCKPNKQFCLRHEPIEDQQQHVLKTIKQCEALTIQEYQCIRNAVNNNKFCGIHLHRELVQSRRPKIYRCIFYEDEDDPEDLIFCDKHARFNKWVCKKHKHHQDFFTNVFSFKNHVEYVNRCNSVKENGIIDHNISLA